MLASFRGIGFGVDDRLTCPQCRRIMRLARRTPDPQRGDDYELQTFGCVTCGEELLRCIDEQGSPLH